MKWVRTGGSWSQSLSNPWLTRMNRRMTNTRTSSNDPLSNKTWVQRPEPPPVRLAGGVGMHAARKALVRVSGCAAAGGVAFFSFLVP